MKRSIAVVFMSFLIGVSCSSTNETGDSGKQLRLAFVTHNSADSWTIARQGVEKADEELPDVTAEFRIASDGTAADH